MGVFFKTLRTVNGIFRLDGERWDVDDDVISRLVEDAIDSESREVLTLSRSRSVTRACDSIEQDY